LCYEADGDIEEGSVCDLILCDVDEGELDDGGGGSDGVAVGCDGGGQQRLACIELHVYDRLFGDNHKLQLRRYYIRVICCSILKAHL